MRKLPSPLSGIYVSYAFLLAFSINLTAQDSLVDRSTLDFKGQLQLSTYFSPQAESSLFFGGRYLPQLDYSYKISTYKTFDIQASANAFANSFIQPFDSISTEAAVRPYRIWARYSGKQFEFRAGLQQIDFGSSQLFRPLQWFNQIDPRDPLQLSNGVYAALARYYFLDNSNIWIWGLYGNSERRGFDLFPSRENSFEFGGRFQKLVPLGEFAISYHYREVDDLSIIGIEEPWLKGEHKIGLETRIDFILGLWLETYTNIKDGSLPDYKIQSFGNLGADYTFSIGNGLTVALEHLNIINSSSFILADESSNDLTAVNLNYPLSFSQGLNFILYHNWQSKQQILFMNYQYQFTNLTGYVMAYYNPTNIIGIQQNEFVNSFAGPGIRLMLVYNH